MYFNEKETNRKVKNIVSKPRKYKTKFQFWLFKLMILGIIALVVCVCAMGLGVFKGILKSAPDVTAEDVQPTGFSSIILDSKDREIQKLSNYESNREEVQFKDIPENLKNAFIAIEDIRFYQHSGIDMQGIVRAAYHGIKTRDLSQGASTITQQLIKNNVFNMGNEKTLIEKVERKIQEQYAAIKLEKEMSKEDILLAYLNTINLGEGTLGVESASKTYFGKNVSELNLSECSVIASITQNPTRYNPIYNPNDNATRRAITLKYMLDANMITQAEYDEAINDDVYARIQEVHQQKKEDPKASSYSYFVDALINDVVEDLQNKLGYNETQAYNLVYSGGLTIYSTQDTAVQKICDKEFDNEANFANLPSGSKYAISYQLSITHINNKTDNYNERDLAKYRGVEPDKMFFATKDDAKAAVEEYKDTLIAESDKYTENLTCTIQPQFSYTIMNQKNGRVMALVGGRGKKSGNLTLNRATDTTRQPGSTFKVLAAYVAALDTAGKSLATVYDDAPYCYEGSSVPVRNYYGGYRGLNTIRTAIRDSMNIITCKCMADVTPQTGYDYLMNMGFTTLVDQETGADGKVYSDITQTLCLGGITRGVTNLELTAAYASIANKGSYNKPILYTKIKDHKGNVILDNTKNEGKQVMKESTAWLLTNAMEDVVKAGTATVANLGTGMAVAGKTGTTSDNLDHWFVGYSPYYTAGIWSGVDSNETFLTNGVEKIIWAKIMNQVCELKKKKVKGFDYCNDISSASVCKKCGKLAVNKLCNKASGGSQVITEYFARNTIPTEKCDCHVKVTICEDSKLLARDDCPHKKTVIMVKRPEDGSNITADNDELVPEKKCKKNHKKKEPAQKTDDTPVETTQEEATTTEHVPMVDE